MEAPEVRYARSGAVSIAYQVTGDGPVDLLYVPGWISHLDLYWEEPAVSRFLRRLAAGFRLMLFDRRGTGLSDRVPDDELPTLEGRMDDARAVLDAAGSEQAVVFAQGYGCPLAIVFAATYPERTRALVLYTAVAKAGLKTEVSVGLDAGRTGSVAHEIRGALGERGIRAGVAAAARSERSRRPSPDRLVCTRDARLRHPDSIPTLRRDERADGRARPPAAPPRADSRPAAEGRRRPESRRRRARRRGGRVCRPADPGREARRPAGRGLPSLGRRPGGTSERGRGVRHRDASGGRARSRPVDRALHRHRRLDRLAREARRPALA